MFRRLSRTDPAHAGLSTAFVLFLVILALLGFAPAAYALPFFGGALLGSAGARLMTRPTNLGWVKAAATSLAALSLVGISLVIVYSARGTNWFGLLEQPYNWRTGAGLFVGVSVFFFFTEILRRVALPFLYPSSCQESQRRKQDQLRNILIVGGLTLFLVLVATAVFAILALISYSVGQALG
jgi:hypothetical protein